MRSRGSPGTLFALYLLSAILVLSVLAVTLPTLATGTETPTPLGRQPEQTATPEPLPSPTRLPTVTAYAPSPATLAAGGANTPEAATPATATPSPPPALLPVGQTGPWHLVFQDEFNNGGLDRSKWTPCYPWLNPARGCTSEGNGELQWYLPQQVTVQNGQLTLSAQPGPYKAPDGHTYDYVSGMVTSGSSQFTGQGFSFQYGYAEARIKIPAAKGVCSAFWLNPADGSWPPEVDIAERVCSTSPNKIEMIVHYALPQGGHDFDTTHFTGPDFTSEWHVFGLQWTPTSLTWYIDGVPQKTFTKTEYVPHKAMYLIFSMAVRGDPAPDDTVQFPTTLSVDYVRVWQR